MRRPNYRTDNPRRTASPPLSPRSTAPARTVSIGTSTADDFMMTDAELPLDPGTNGGRTPQAALHWDLRSYLDAEDPVAPAPRAQPARRRRQTDLEPAGTASTARAAPPRARRPGLPRVVPPMVGEWWMLDSVTWMEEEEFAKKSWPEARNMSVEEVAEYNRKAVKEDREENERLGKPKKGSWYLPGSLEFFHDI